MILKSDALIKAKLQQEHDKLKTTHNKVKQLYLDEMSMNKMLRENQQINQKQHQQALQKKDEEINELQEQLRDLMFYLETRDKVAVMDEEEKEDLQQGQVKILENKPKKNKKKKKK